MLNAGSVKQMADGLKAPDESLPGSFALANKIAALLIQPLYIFLVVLESLGWALGRARTTQDFWSLVSPCSGSLPPQACLVAFSRSGAYSSCCAATESHGYSPARFRNRLIRALCNWPHRLIGRPVDPRALMLSCIAKSLRGNNRALRRVS